MENKVRYSITEQLLKDLTKSEILTYYTLKTYDNKGWFNVSNEQLGKIMKVDPTAAARSIKGLRDKGYVKASYKKDGYGTVRKIKIVEETAHVGRMD